MASLSVLYEERRYKMTHYIRILPEYFKVVEHGKKRFELRKNDRDYKVGDNIVLQEWDGRQRVL